MSPMLQARLLRVIEQGEVMRLGDSSIVPVNVRLIAATHRDLRKMVENQEFREDLYYRLNVLSLKIPPLKYRDKDIISIAYQFLAEFCSRRGKPPGKFTPEAEKILLNYSWPGNIRELRNAMERLGMRPWKNEIGFMDVSKALLLDEEEDAFNLELSPESSSIQKNDMYSSILDKRISTVEKHVIQKVLQECEGKKAEAARRLGISRTTLWRKSQD